MRLALLKGNRFNPWHLQVFGRLDPPAKLTAFRAESEIQRRFRGRDDGSVALDIESIAFDTDAGPLLSRKWYRFQERFLDRAPRILPFADRLADFDAIQTWELFTDWTWEALEAKRRFGVPVSVMVWDTIAFNQESNDRQKRIKERALAEADRFIKSPGE